MLQKLIQLQKSQQNNISLAINYLFIAYAFCLPMAFDTEKIILKIIFILFLFSGELKEKLLFSLKNRIFQAMMIFLALYIIWLYGSEHREIGWWKIKIFASYFFLFVIYITSIREDFKEKIINAFIVAIFTSEIISYTMFFGFHFSFIKYMGYGANVPFFYTYSQYVLLLSLSLGLVLYRLLTHTTHSKIQTLLYSFFFLSSSINVFTINSKLGYALYLVSIFTVILFLGKQYISRTKIFLLLATIVATYLLAFNYNKTFQTKIDNISSQLSLAYHKNIFIGSTGERLGWDIYGMQIYMEHNPLVGVGTSDHIDLLEQKIKNLHLNSNLENRLLRFLNKALPGMSTFHNEYLDHLVQFGVIGVFVLFYLFYSIYKAESISPYFQLLKYLLLINIVLYSFVNYFFILPQLAKIFFFLIALTLPSFKPKEQ